MRSLCLVFVLCATPALAQTIVQEGQTLTAEWVADCTHICDQPAGTAGFRLIVDGTVLVDLGPVPSGSDTVAPLPAIGLHTVALEAYNCSACAGGEVSVRGPSAAFEVIAADPPPPNTPPAPTLTVSP